MKTKQILTIGVTAGMILAMSIQAFAAPEIQKVEAYLNHEMIFTFDGEKKVLPEDYEVLVYKDRAYVPARFVAENLGATVNWDNAAKEISVTAKKEENPVEPSKPGDTSDKGNDKYTYAALPLYKENSDFKMSVTQFSDDEYGHKLNVTLENKTDTPIQLDQMKTSVVIDGKSYSMEKATITHLDARWYKDIKKEDKIEGYVRLPNDIKEYKNMHVEFSVRSNGGYSEKVQAMTFDIDLK